MRQSVGFLFMLLLSIQALSQNTELEKILAKPDDTLKVRELLNLGRKIRSNSYEDAGKVFQRALDLSKKIDYEWGKGASFLNLGGVMTYLGDIDNGISYVQRAYDIYTRLNNSKGVATCHSSLGGMYATKGKFDSAIIHLMSALQLMGDIKPGHEHKQLYHNIGTLYNSLKDYSNAITYHEKALAVSTSLQDTTYIVISLGSLQMAYRNMGNNEKSYDYALRALQLAKQKNDSKSLYNAYQSYAEMCIKLDKHDEAINAGKKALHYALSLKDVVYQILVSTTLAEAYEKLGQLEKAADILEHAKAIGEKAGLKSHLRNVYAGLANINNKLGNYKTALDEYEKFNATKDSLGNEKNKKTIAELEIKYQTAQKERILSLQHLQISQKEVQLQRSRQVTIYSIAATLVAMLGAALVYLHYRNKQRLHQQQLQAIQREKELQLLQAVIEGEEKERGRIAKDLHDEVAGMLAAAKMHFSSLSIQNAYLSEAKEYNQGIELLNEVTIQVRKTSHNLMPEVLIKYGLETALAKYCANISNDQVLVVRYNCCGEVKRYDSSFELALYRIVQELLNNVIKHSRAKEAYVQLSAFDDRLCIMIEDNGVGLKGNVKNEGMGLQSLETRVKAMNGRFEIQTASSTGLSAFLEFNIEGLEK